MQYSRDRVCDMYVGGRDAICVLGSKHAQPWRFVTKISIKTNYPEHVNFLIFAAQMGFKSHYDWADEQYKAKCR